MTRALVLLLVVPPLLVAVTLAHRVVGEIRPAPVVACAGCSR